MLFFWKKNNIIEIILKITKIDREYKKHNKQAVAEAIKNGTIILLCTGIVLNSDSNISNFGTQDLSNLFNSIIEFAEYLPKSELLVAFYTKTFDGINQIIDNIGLMGLILATKSVNFILSTIKDVNKTLKIKKELLQLEKKLNENQEINNYAK